MKTLDRNERKEILLDILPKMLRHYTSGLPKALSLDYIQSQCDFQSVFFNNKPTPTEILECLNQLIQQGVIETAFIGDGYRRLRGGDVGRNRYYLIGFRLVGFRLARS
ncbi:hypothetical protein KGQ34_02865 [Patescibacteria group bacterium]|nr:hypothetical protein [Patescibacteria group bacterium]